MPCDGPSPGDAAMLMFPANARVFYCPAPDSLGLSCDGPAGAVCSLMKRDPLEEGSLSVFFNRRRTMVKILQWEGDGFSIWGKRLERGQFNVPLSADGRLALEARELAAILAGVRPARYYRRHGSSL